VLLELALWSAKFHKNEVGDVPDQEEVRTTRGHRKRARRERSIM